jgi:hypothetical protein
MVPTWKTKTSEFLDAGGYNRNERARNWRLGTPIREQGEIDNVDIRGLTS